MMSKVLQDLIKQLGMTAFRLSDKHTLEAVSNYPNWLIQLSNSASSALSENETSVTFERLGNVFPFLANFLIDAEAFWHNKRDQEQAESGVWTEVDALGQEFQLEAKALWVNDEKILLIENVSHNFEERHLIYQKARDMALLNEKLISELNFRQRKLQSDIERHLTLRNPIDELNRTVEANTSAVLVCLPDGDVELYNKALINIYELGNEQKLIRASILDKWIAEAELNHPEIHRLLESGSYWEGEFETFDTENNQKWIRLSIGPVKNEEGEICHFVCVANDLSDYRKVNDDWGNISDYDFNTHLPNRRQFWKHISQICEAGKESDEKIALMYVDLDYFKHINDQHGQFAGDFLLGTMASRLSRNIKHGDYIAHLGGDEFVILLRYLKEPDDLIAVGERILVTISEPINLDGTPIRTTASIGIAISELCHTDPHSFLRNADLAMYSAKELGRSQVRLYSKDLEDNLPKRGQREHELSIAIDKHQFVLAFQPQIGVRQNKGKRVEALIRWNHPELGLLSPSEFIGIAEESGSIIPIGDWVLMNACLHGKQLIDSGDTTHIAVNISAKQLGHPEFYNKLVDTLKTSHFPAEQLELEITESSFLCDMNKAIDVLHRVRELGIQVALDDFGSGFSSLNYLKRLPVDYIKIDRSFVHDLPDDNESRAITTSVIHLAHQLNMQVIAEGVETKQQLDFLTEHQVDFVQGYYYFRPMPFAELQTLQEKSW